MQHPNVKMKTRWNTNVENILNIISKMCYSDKFRVLLQHFHICIDCTLTTLYHPSFIISITTFPYLISTYSKSLIDSCLLKRMWLPGFSNPIFSISLLKLDSTSMGWVESAVGTVLKLFSVLPQWFIEECTPSQTFLIKRVKVACRLCKGSLFKFVFFYLYIQEHGKY